MAQQRFDHGNCPGQRVAEAAADAAAATAHVGCVASEASGCCVGENLSATYKAHTLSDGTPHIHALNGLVCVQI